MNQILDITNKDSYVKLLEGIKSEILQSGLKAHFAVNKELIMLYWNIGKRILEKQESEGWGAKVIDNISRDLRQEFPEMKGFSITNLKYMKVFASNFKFEEISQQAAGQIPWFHICTIIDKVSSHEQRMWYIQKTLENGWSRNVLNMNIKTNLYERDGRSITNFQNTLPQIQSDLAQSIIKDPYNLEFLTVKTII